MFMTVLVANMNTMMARENFMDFNDRNFLHRWLTSQTHTDRVTEKILYRIERTENALYFYVQTLHPFLEHNLRKAGLKKLSSFEVRVPEDGKITFKIFCTSHRQNHGDDRNGKVKAYFIKDESERIERMKGRLAPFMTDLHIEEKKTDRVLFKKGEQYRKVPGSEFVGNGTVTDRDAFLEAVANGFGKSKNYGMGLLLYKPAV